MAEKKNNTFKGILILVLIAVIAGLVLMIINNQLEERRIQNKINTLFNEAISLQSSELYNKALGKYEKILDYISEAGEPKFYSSVKHNVGVCYYRLAEHVNLYPNIDNAIANFYDALRTRKVEKFPNDFASTQEWLGKSYSLIAEHRETAKNIDMALKFFRKSLSVFELETSCDHSRLLNLIGAAYIKLSEVNNTEVHLENAQKNLKEIENIGYFKLDGFDRACSQLNLGATYLYVSEFKNEYENLLKAVQQFKNSLKIFTIEQFPDKFADVNNNLGIAYIKLTKFTEEKDRYNKAQRAFDLSLKINKYDTRPIAYASTQNNIGGLYLWSEGKKEENLIQGLQAFEKGLSVISIKEYPRLYTDLLYNKGIAYLDLVKFKDPKDCIKKAIDCFNTALKVKVAEKYPNNYADIQNRLCMAYGKLSIIENKGENLFRSLNYCMNALRIYKQDYYPLRYKRVISNLNKTKASISEGIKSGEITPGTYKFELN